MTKPTEAEVEAAAKVMAGFCIGGIIDEPKLPWPCWMGSARAMLTAAAQVRERAAEQHKRDRPCAICAGTGRFVIGMICST